MADDRKRTEQVKLLLTERELLDLSRAAAADDRKISDFAHHILRRHLYGSVGVRDRDVDQILGPDQGLRA